jgi:copper chaperone CopZ
MQSKLTLVIFILFVFAKSASAETEHVHNHDTTATPSVAVATERYEGFVKDLKDSKVAVVNVIGMVCDFCARGIEKTFNKDEFVRKVDVDLANGQVLIAYSADKLINQKEISELILANGQNVTGIEIIKI